MDQTQHHFGIIHPEGRILNKASSSNSEFKITGRDFEQHVPLKKGNSEIWYCYIYDFKNELTIIIQFFFQTEVLKEDIEIYTSIYTYSPKTGVFKETKKHLKQEFECQKEKYNLKIGHNQLKHHKNRQFFLRYQSAKAQADFELIPQSQGWKPFRNGYSYKDKKRKGFMNVVCFVPKGIVNGELIIQNKKYVISKAYGYHDHTIWNSESKPELFPNKLFIDDTISKWEWAKLYSKEYTIILSSIYHRPWVKSNPLISLLVLKNNQILHSSNNLARIYYSDYKYDIVANCRLPEKIKVELRNNSIDLQATFQTDQYLEKINYINRLKFIQRKVIRLFFGNPCAAYCTTNTELILKMPEKTKINIKGNGFYGIFSLNESPGKFEDWLRKNIHKNIR